MAELATDPLVDSCSELVSQLGFSVGEQNLFFGSYRQFPLSVSLILGGKVVILLFHIRHPAEAPEVATMTPEYGAELAGLIAIKSVSVELEANGAWLQFHDAADLLRNGRVIPLLDQTLDAFEKLGLGDCAGRCHRCRVSTVERPRFLRGRVEQVCDGCLNRAQARFKETHGLQSDAVPKLLAMAAVGILSTGVTWALAWTAYDWVLGKTGALFVPRLVAILMMAGISYLCGQPVGWLLARIPHRGDRVAAALAIVVVLAGIFLGDILQCAWIVFRQLKSVSFAQAMDLLGPFYQALSVFGWFFHLIVAIMACYFAAEAARPPRTPVNQ